LVGVGKGAVVTVSISAVGLDAGKRGTVSSSSGRSGISSLLTLSKITGLTVTCSLSSGLLVLLSTEGNSTLIVKASLLLGSSTSTTDSTTNRAISSKTTVSAKSGVSLKVLGESSVSLEIKVLLDLVVELETLVELNLGALGFKLAESFGLQTDLNVKSHLVVSVDFKFVLHLDFAASLEVKADLKLISAFEFKGASFKLLLVLQFAVRAVTLSTPSTRVRVALASLVA